MKIDGEFLSNLRFADDIFLCTEIPQELQQMLQELSDESRQMGLKMNIAKTKVREQCADRKCPRLRVLGTTLQPQGKEPGQRDTTKNHGRAGRHTPNTGISSKATLAICLKRQVYNSCVLPAMTYGAETWDTDQTSTRTNLRPHRPKWKEVCSHHIQR